MGLKHLFEKIEPHFTEGSSKSTTRCMKQRRPFSTRGPGDEGAAHVRDAST